MIRNILLSRNTLTTKIGLFFLLFTFGSIIQLFGQVSGDYRSKATGVWNANTTWEKYTNQWADALPGDYPGKSSTAGTVTIRSGFNGTLNVNAACNELIIGTGANVTSILTFNINTVLTVSGDVTLGNVGQRRGSINMTRGGLLQIGGTLTAPNLGTWTPGGGTVEYNGSAQTLYSDTYNNLILSGSGAKTTTDAAINGILSLEGTATTAGTIATYGADATLQYKGNAAQTTGIEFPATWSGSGGVIIDNTLGVTLGASKTISSKLTLNNGILTTGANLLTVTNNSTSAITGGSASNFVNGSIKWSIGIGS